MTRIGIQIAAMLWALAFIVLCPLISSGEIIFEDNFDSHPKWNNKKGSRTPKGWTSHSYDGGNYGLSDGEIKVDANYKNKHNIGKKGKGFRVNVERDWAAAGLHKLFSGENAKHDQLYFRWYQRYSKNFHWDQSIPNSPGHKWIRLADETRTKILRIGLGTGRLYWYGQVSLDGMHFKQPSFTWEMFNHGNGCGNNCHGSNKWRCIELRVKLNTRYTGAPSNGIVEVWIDGVLVGQDKEAFIRKTPDQHLSYVQLGGNMSAPDMVQPVEYYVDIDDFIVSTQRNGPFEMPAPPKRLRVIR